MAVQRTMAIARKIPGRISLAAVMVVVLSVVIYEAREAGRLSQENRWLLAQNERLVEERDGALKSSRRATHASPRLPAPAVSLSPAERGDFPFNRRLFALI